MSLDMGLITNKNKINYKTAILLYKKVITTDPLRTTKNIAFSKKLNRKQVNLLIYLCGQVCSIPLQK
jgi:hypothetical protein